MEVKTLSSDWSSSIGMDNGYSAAQNFIFQNGIQPFHNNLQGEIISDGIHIPAAARLYRVVVKNKQKATL